MARHDRGRDHENHDASDVTDATDAADAIASIDSPTVARMLGLTPNGLAIIRRKGGGPPFYRIGRTVRYRVADVRRWIAERTVGR